MLLFLNSIFFYDRVVGVMKSVALCVLDLSGCQECEDANRRHLASNAT